jgi:hypothetical protein
MQVLLVVAALVAVCCMRHLNCNSASHIYAYADVEAQLTLAPPLLLLLCT